MAWEMEHFKIGDRVAVSYRNVEGGRPGKVVRAVLDETAGEWTHIYYDIQLDDDPEGYPRIIPAFRVKAPAPPEGNDAG